jgi:hypothetical protein
MKAAQLHRIPKRKRSSRDRKGGHVLECAGALALFALWLERWLRNFVPKKNRYRFRFNL